MKLGMWRVSTVREESEMVYTGSLELVEMSTSAVVCQLRPPEPKQSTASVVPYEANIRPPSRSSFSTRSMAVRKGQRGKEGGKEGRKEGGREGGREGGKEGGREGGREEGREGGKEGGGERDKGEKKER